MQCCAGACAAYTRGRFTHISSMFVHHVFLTIFYNILSQRTHKGPKELSEHKRAAVPLSADDGRRSAATLFCPQSALSPVVSMGEQIEQAGALGDAETVCCLLQAHACRVTPVGHAACTSPGWALGPLLQNYSVLRGALTALLLLALEPLQGTLTRTRINLVASSSKAVSEFLGPMRDRPTGQPSTMPIGSVTCASSQLGTMQIGLGLSVARRNADSTA